MNNEINETIKRLYHLARQWHESTSEDRGREKISQKFRHALEELSSKGWNGFLGEEHELPDEYLPDQYITRRTAELSRLEDDLAQIATNYRTAPSGSAIRQQLVKSYEEVLRKMFFIGHWSREPELESQLPDNDMPNFYKAYWN